MLSHEVCLLLRLRPVEPVLALLAARAPPVVRQIVKRDAVVLGRIVDIAAHGADVFPAGLAEGNVSNGHARRGIVQVHDLPGVQVLAAQRRVGGKINSRMGPDERPHGVQRASRGGDVLEHDGEPVRVRWGHFAHENIHAGGRSKEAEESQGV